MNSIRFTKLNLKNKELTYLKYYLIASALEASVCFGLFFLFPNNNFFISHFFFTVQLFFLSFFYYGLFEKAILKKFVKYATILLFLISTSQYIINPDAFWQFNLIEIIGVCSMLICFGLMYLYNTMGENKMYFYFSIGMIMYFLCTCIIYLSGNLKLIFLENPYIDHWIIKDLFFIIFQLLIWKEFKILKQND